MAEDLLTALALVLIIEGLLPGLAPRRWLRVMEEAANLSPKVIRFAGIASMLAGALLLQLPKS